MITRRWSAALLCGLFAAFMAGTLTTGAVADETTPDSQEGPPPRVDLVLDVSGSMRERDMSDGQSRMAAAQQAFNEVIDAVPDEVYLGIRTLGATYPGDDVEVGCQDSEQLYPVGPVDRTEAKTAVATLRPTGWTPIGLALRGANEDLGDEEGTRRVVLITDGEDSCGDPDPCVVARELAASGTNLVVDTLGLTLDDAVREQLSCIAEATGGTYTAVQDAGQLGDRLNQLVRRADLPVEEPTDVAGAEECQDAPQLGVGVYNDRAVFGEHRWYRVAVQPGQELRASVSVAADREVNPDYGVLLRAVDERGRELTRGTGAGSGRTDVVSTGLRYPVPQEEDEDGDGESTADGASGDSGDGEGNGEAGVRYVCLDVGDSFSAPDAVQREPGLPVELTVDVVSAPGEPGDVAAFGLARGWVPLVLLTGAGLVAGLAWGLLARLGTAIGRAS
ncbi:VWA domain-containing protein [Streptomyces hoynatensis]|uniref:VWA domain-containing protein n=1 Tax=Streptomyces hoynatensis TaxID=1141874 RepID=A0A3A9Z2B0_9ACTN|nr:VWA domain-containing protein [Streptomyces hoynatensis]RKN42383.1 VWA domain-containing protein [Streptomyces hoynatensis]